ncbi:MAG: hypothetical protein JWM77_365 [Rhodospirillales bacterium]|nr:hypothetical protein [Rhodospirillales bacterium]
MIRHVACLQSAAENPRPLVLEGGRSAIKRPEHPWPLTPTAWGT